jgi:hypothetical protein
MQSGLRLFNYLTKYLAVFGVEALRGPVGSRIGALVPLAVKVAERTVYDLGGWSL